MAIEYKDVTVSLNVWGKVPAGGIGQQEAARQASIVAAPNANAAILDTLNREGAQGWQPADANTDLYGLFLAGRVRWRQTGGILLSWKITFDSATLRLKRIT